MTNPDENQPNGAENEKNKSELEDSTTVDIDPHDESKAQLINGGAGGDDHPEKFKTAIVDPGAASSDGEVSFNGLGKDEVLQYANDPFWVRLRWVMFILFWVGWLAMLVTAVAIIVLAPRCPHRPDLKWYHTDNVYEVYGKSFKDSDGDGKGDFQGLKDKMEYITDDLDTKAIWLSSIYKNSGGGILDHKALDPSFVDDLGKFKSWVKKMRKEGKKVVMDLVPNHTSRNHTWFMKSLKSEGKYKNYYMWGEGSITKYPNDWQTDDRTDSLWEYDDTRKACFMRRFSGNPELNLTNPDVIEEIKDIMKFWFDAGVSGFHIQNLEHLVENPDLPNEGLNHLSETRNYPGTLAFLEELRKVAEEFSDKPGRERLLFGTVYHANRTQIEAYWGTKDQERLHIVAPVMTDLKAGCDAKCVKKMIEGVISEDTDEEQWLGLQVGNAMVSRISSRMVGSDDMYKHRLVTSHALQLLLPGTPFVYYGDEFGQRDGAASGKEKYHAPMQWDNTANAGFSEKTKPWTPVSPYYAVDNVEAGRLIFKDMTPFQAYQELTELRKEESFQFGKTKLCTVGNNLLMFSRHASRFPFFVTFVNMGKEEVVVSASDLSCLSTKDKATVRFHSRDEKVGDEVDLEDSGLHLSGFDVVVFEFAADD